MGASARAGLPQGPRRYRSVSRNLSRSANLQPGLSSGMRTVATGLPVAHQELATGWPVIVACTAAAIFAWGFGAFGPAVYFAELKERYGWPAATDRRRADARLYHRRATPAVRRCRYRAVLAAPRAHVRPSADRDR